MLESYVMVPLSNRFLPLNSLPNGMWSIIQLCLIIFRRLHFDLYMGIRTCVSFALTSLCMVGLEEIILFTLFDYIRMIACIWDEHIFKCLCVRPGVCVWLHFASRLRISASRYQLWPYAWSCLKIIPSISNSIFICSGLISLLPYYVSLIKGRGFDLMHGHATKPYH